MPSATLQVYVGYVRHSINGPRPTGTDYGGDVGGYVSMTHMFLCSSANDSWMTD